MVQVKRFLSGGRESGVRSLLGTRFRLRPAFAGLPARHVAASLPDSRLLAPNSFHEMR